MQRAAIVLYPTGEQSHCEIGETYISIFIEEDIRWVEVTMNNTLAVQVL